MTEIEKLEEEFDSCRKKSHELRQKINQLKLKEYNFEGKYIYVPDYGYMHVSWQKYDETEERVFFQGLYFNSEYTPYSDANWFCYSALDDWYIPIRTFNSIKDKIEVLSKEKFIEKFKQMSSQINENFDKYE